MKSKVVSFQVTQETDTFMPHIIALCADGTLWIAGMRSAFEDADNWKMITPELPKKPREMPVRT